MMKVFRKRFGDSYWLDPDNVGPIPEGNGEYRFGPKMLKVYDNAHSLFNVVLVMDAITLAAWTVVILGLGPLALDPPKGFLVVVMTFMVVLGVITAACVFLTLFAVRAERLMVVIGYGRIKGKPIMGMHADWPEFEEDGEEDHSESSVDSEEAYEHGA